MNRKIVILDENKNIINSRELSEDEPLYVKSPDEIKGLKRSKYEKVLLNVDDGIDVLIPYNDNKDFVIQNASYHTADFLNTDYKELFNKSYNIFNTITINIIIAYIINTITINIR